jgi:hypothetical protein
LAFFLWRLGAVEFGGIFMALEYHVSGRIATGLDGK